MQKRRADSCNTVACSRKSETHLLWREKSGKHSLRLPKSSKWHSRDQCHLLFVSQAQESWPSLVPGLLFSDEKIFTLDSKINQRNDRCLVCDPRNMPIVGRKFPGCAGLSSVVSSKKRHYEIKKTISFSERRNGCSRSWNCYVIVYH